MILLDLLELMVVSYPDLRIYLHQIPSCRCLPNLFPVLLIVPLDWLGSKFPRTLEACVLLHAVCICTIVDLDRLEMSLATVLLERCHSLPRLLEIEEELDVRGPILPLLQLTTDVPGSTDLVPFFQIFNYKLWFGIV